MRLLLALCLITTVAVVTFTPASAEPRPGFGSWVEKVRNRIQNVVDKYRSRIIEVAETYRNVKDTWENIRNLFRGRRSVDKLEYSVPALVGARKDKLITELDDLIESIVAEVITATVIGNKEKYDWSVEKSDISKEDHDEKEGSSEDGNEGVGTIGTIFYHPKALK